MTPHLRRELLILARGWSLLICAGALLGGLWGWLVREDDDA